MAAFQIPPWLNPPDIIGAAARGASIGAELRGQDIQQASAADRLRAAYDQLALKEQYANERAADRQALMSQGLEIRRQALENQAQRNADLAQYQQGLLAERGKSDEARAESAADLLGLREESLKQRTDFENRIAAAREAAGKSPKYHFGTQGEVIKVDPETGQVTTLQQPRGSGRPSAFDLQTHSSLLAEEKALRRSLADTPQLPGMEDSQLKTVNRIAQIHKQISDLEKKYSTQTLGNEAIMYHGNRPVVVDPTTKKVLRYADEPADMGTTDGSTDESD